MSSKKETTKEKKAAKPEVTLKSFYFPTIMDGITIKAATREEANKKAEALIEQSKAPAATGEGDE